MEGCGRAATDKWMCGRSEMNKAHVIKVGYEHWINSSVLPVMASSVKTLSPNKVMCYHHDDS